MEDFFENELSKKFEEMIENNEEYYFDSEELEEIVIHYLEIGDISFAELAVNYALQLHPNALGIKSKKLEVLLELEQYPQAKILINELREYGTMTTDFLVCCAKYYSNLGNPRRAIEYCKEALKIGEEENFLHNFIADECVNLDDPFEALKHYKLALKIDPDDDYALENIMHCYNLLNRSEEAIAFLKHYLDRFPFSETGWFEYGQFYFNKKNYEEAILGFDYLLAINAQILGAYANKASCYEGLKAWDKAISVYEEMLELEYTKAFTYYRIGLCHKENKNLTLALMAFQKSLAEDPQFYLSMMEQSYLYEEMGRMIEALHFAKEATSLNENNLDFQKRLAFLYIDGEHFVESLSCLEKITDAEPERFYNWYAYSEVLMLLGEYNKAISVLQKATKRHHKAELYYQMSNSYFRLNNDKKGKIILDIALSINPSLLEDMKLKYPSIENFTNNKEKSKKK